MWTELTNIGWNVFKQFTVKENIFSFDNFYCVDFDQKMSL